MRLFAVNANQEEKANLFQIVLERQKIRILQAIQGNYFFLRGVWPLLYFTAMCFNELFPDRPIDHKYDSNLITKFRNWEC